MKWYQSFGLYTVIHYYYFHLIQVYLREHLDQRSSSYIVSTYHAILCCLFQFYYLFYPSDQLHTFIYSFSLAYCLIDSQHLYQVRKEHKYATSMVLHHLGMAASLILGEVLNVHHPESTADYYGAIGFLAEASTPILNYIQFYHGKVSWKVKYLFALVYFFCRPISLTYCSYMLTYELGTFTFKMFLPYFFTLLNWYWFYKIYRKSFEHQQPEIPPRTPSPKTPTETPSAASSAASSTAPPKINQAATSLFESLTEEKPLFGTIKFGNKSVLKFHGKKNLFDSTSSSSLSSNGSNSDEIPLEKI